MKKSFLLITAIILCVISLSACNNDDASNTDSSTDSNSGVVSVAKFDLQNVENLQCEIRFGQTGEELIFEKEKALELYNIINEYDYTQLNGFPTKSSVNPLKDYVYVYFTGDTIIDEELPLKEYGHYTIYIDDVVGWNLSVYMSAIFCYQYEDGLYEQVNQYITENR